MCRGVEHGGRRCPNDNSEARRIRRANATAKAKFTEKSESLKPIKVLVTQEETPNANNMPSMETIKAKLDELAALRKEQADIREKNEHGFYVKEVEGGLVGRDNLEGALVVKMEAKVTQIGNDIRMLAISRTGFSDEKMVEVMDNNQRIFLEAYDKAEKEALEYEAFLAEKYADPNALAEDITSGKDLVLYAQRMETHDVKEAQEDYKEWSRLQTVKFKAHNEISTAMANPPVEVTEMQKANAEEFRKIIGEVRPLGGKVKVSETSAKKETKIIDEIAATYPSDWIQASNESNELRIKKTAGRAHYSHQKEQKSFVVAPMVSVKGKPEGWEPDLYDRHNGAGWVKIEHEPDEYGDSYYVEPKSGMKYSINLKEGEVAWLAPRHEYFSKWNHRSKEDGSPSGRGWEECTVKTSDYIDGKHVERLETTWRRPMTRRLQTQSIGMAELTVDSEPSRFGSTGYATALHEFAHRVETTGPAFLNVMQREFIRRRTTDENGVRESKQSIYSWSKRETGRFDNFADKYMGKEYPGTPNHEILSTGAEAVFAGKFGGLSGVGKYSADPDMKNFILGLWATG